MKPNIQYSIVIPIYNEKESLDQLFKASAAFFSKIKETYEFICVDDGSSDGSYEEMLNLKKRHAYQMTIIKFRKNLGKSAAIREAFLYAKGEIIITLDADLQDDPEELSEAIQRIKEDTADFVVGWRKERNDAKGKIKLSHVFNRVVSRFFDVSLHDMNCGLKVMKKSVAHELELYGELHRYIPVLAASRGFRVDEVIVQHHERKYGTSKFGSERMLRAAFDLITTLFITSFKLRPMHIFGLGGVIVGIMGIIPLVYLTYLHFIGISIGRRPLLFLGILFVLCGVQLFSTGLLAELFVHFQDKKNQAPIDSIS